MKRLGKLAAAVGTVVFLTACNQKFTIEAPAKDYVNNQQPELFKVAFPDGKPGNLTFQLNTADVTALFTVGDKQASATGDQLAKYIVPGRNVFRVRSGIASQLVYFHYDVVGPKIHILEARHDTGSIKGYLQDSSSIQSLTIDGKTLPVDDKGYFQGTFTSQPVSTVSASDSYGNVNTVNYARNDQEFHPAMSARINDGGFKFLSIALEEALGKVDFTSMLAANDPLVNILEFKVRARDLRFDKPTIRLSVLDNERLKAHFTIPNMVISTQTGYDIAPIGSTVVIETVTVDTEILLDIVNKDVSVSVQGTRVNMENMDIRYDNFPNLIKRNLLLESMSNTFIGIMIPPIENMIVPIVSNFLGEIPIKVDITTHENETLRVRALPEFLDTKNNGMTLDLGASVRAPFPSPEAVPTLGHPYTPGDTPTIGETTPSGKAFDIGASISTNLLNQAMLAAHESGLTRFSIHPTSVKGATPEGISVIKNDGGEEIKNTDLIGMRLEPISPPSLTLMDREGTWGNLVWNDVTLAFDLKREGWDEYRTLFVTTFNLEVPFELGATDDGFLRIGIEKLPTIEILESKEKGSLVLSPVFINGVLDHVLPAVMPKIAAELKSVPLPRIAGHSIRPEQFWVSGSGKNNLSVAGSLIPLKTTETATPADTNIDFSAPGTLSATVVSNTTKSNVENANVTVSINGVNPTSEPLEYRYRVDNGAWSVWKERNAINLYRMLGGDHTIEVCSRTIFLKQEVECPTLNFNTRVK